MSYEIRKIENSNLKCPKCNGRTVKFGYNSYNKKPKRKCQDCGYSFTPELYNVDSKDIGDHETMNTNTEPKPSCGNCKSAERPVTGYPCNECRKHSKYIPRY